MATDIEGPGVHLAQFDQLETRDAPGLKVNGALTVGENIGDLGGLTIGRAIYQPGWRWSLHVGPGLGLDRCPVEHVGMVISGEATAAFADLLGLPAP